MPIIDGRNATSLGARANLVPRGLNGAGFRQLSQNAVKIESCEDRQRIIGRAAQDTVLHGKVPVHEPAPTALATGVSAGCLVIPGLGLDEIAHRTRNTSARAFGGEHCGRPYQPQTEQDLKTDSHTHTDTSDRLIPMNLVEGFGRNRASER